FVFRTAFADHPRCCSDCVWFSRGVASFGVAPRKGLLTWPGRQGPRLGVTSPPLIRDSGPSAKNNIHKIGVPNGQRNLRPNGSLGGPMEADTSGSPDTAPEAVQTPPKRPRGRPRKNIVVAPPTTLVEKNPSLRLSPPKDDEKQFERLLNAER